MKRSKIMVSFTILRNLNPLLIRTWGKSVFLTNTG